MCYNLYSKGWIKLNDNSKVKIPGIIKWYKENKGYGYIIGMDDTTYYFENNQCVNPNEKFEKDERVLFVPNFIHEFATEVEKVKKENE